MQPKSFLLGLALAGLAPALLNAEEPVKVIHTSIKYFTVNDKTFKELNLKALCGTDQGVASVGTGSTHVALQNRPRAISVGEMEKLYEEMVTKYRRDIRFLNAPTITTLTGQTAGVQIGGKKTFTTKMTIESKNGRIAYALQEEEIDLTTSFKITPQRSADGSYLKFDFRAERSGLENSKVPNFPILTDLGAALEGGAPDQQGFQPNLMQYIQMPKVVRYESDASMSALPDGASFMVYLGATKTESTGTVRLPIFNSIPALNGLFETEFAVPDVEHYCVMLTVNVVLPDAPAAKRTECERMAPIQQAACVAPPIAIKPPVLLPVSAAETPACAVNKVVSQGHMIGLQTPGVFGGGDFPIGTNTSSLAILPCAVPEATCPNDIAAHYSNSAKGTPPQHAEILKILLEQYEVACRAGDSAKAKVIAAYCVEMDPTCFSKK